MRDSEFGGTSWLVFCELAVVVVKSLCGCAVISCPECWFTECCTACDGELLVVSGGTADHVGVGFDVVHVGMGFSLFFLRGSEGCLDGCSFFWCG